MRAICMFDSFPVLFRWQLLVCLLTIHKHHSKVMPLQWWQCLFFALNSPKTCQQLNPDKAEFGRGCKSSWRSGALLPPGRCFGSKAAASSAQAIWSQLRCIHTIGQIKLSEGLGGNNSLKDLKKRRWTAWRMKGAEKQGSAEKEVDTIPCGAVA